MGLAVALVGTAALVASGVVAASRDSSTHLLVAAAGDTSDTSTSTTVWVSPCEVTVPPELQNNPDAVAEAAAQEKSNREDLGEICLSPQERQKVGEQQAAADAAKRADPNFKFGPDPNLKIGPGVPDPPGLAVDGSIWGPAIWFSPTNEWIEPPGSAFLRLTAGFVPGGDQPEHRVAVDTGAVVVVLRQPGEPLSSDDAPPLQLFRAPDGVGRLKITEVKGDTAYLVTADGTAVTFDITDHTFSVG